MKKLTLHIENIIKEDLSQVKKANQKKMRLSSPLLHKGTSRKGISRQEKLTESQRSGKMKRYTAKMAKCGMWRPDPIPYSWMR